MRTASAPLQYASFFNIARDHRNRLIWPGSLDGSIYGYRTSGTVAASFAAPAGYPYGMAYYGQYMWVGCDGNDYVYRVHCPGTVSLEPASFGRVKGFYHQVARLLTTRTDDLRLSTEKVRSRSDGGLTFALALAVVRIVARVFPLTFSRFYTKVDKKTY